MNAKFRFIALIITLTLIGISVFFFSSKGSEESSQISGQNGLTIVSTITPIGSLVEEFALPDAKTSVLVPPGASPHTYEPTPQQLTALADADLLVTVGTPIEFELVWLDKLKAVNEDIKVVDLSEGVELREFKDNHAEEDGHEEEQNGDHSHDGEDPHIWLSPSRVQIMVENLSKALIEVDPGQAGHYQQILVDVLIELDNIDQSLASSFSAMSEKTLMVYHDSWGYFADDYGLELLVIEQEGKEPTARELAETIQRANERSVSTIIVSPEFSQQSAQTIAEQLSLDVVEVSPLPERLIQSFEQLAGTFQSSL